MPMADLEEMLGAATAIESRERLQRIADGQIAAGLAKKTEARRHLAELREAAAKFRRAEAPRSQDFVELGFEVVRLPRRSE